MVLGAQPQQQQQAAGSTSSSPRAIRTSSGFASPRHRPRQLQKQAAPQAELTIDETTFQPFDEPPQLLPGDVKPKDALQAAFTRMQFRSAHDESLFTRGCLSNSYQRLLCAFAWYAIYTRFPNCANEEAADRLFSHIASAYARACSEGTNETKDALAWYLPEALSYAAVLGWREAYRREHDKHKLNETMRRALFEQFVGWTSGFGGATGRHVKKSSEMAARGDGHAEGLGGLSARPTRPPARSPRVPLKELLDAKEEGAGGPAATESKDDSFTKRRRGGKGGGAAAGGAAAGGAAAGGATAGDGEEIVSPRRSMVLRGLPPLRREARDVSACSPLMARWLKLRTLESEARGGSGAREPHRLRCTDAAGRGLEVMDKLVDKGALTYRDVRTASSRRADHLVSDYVESLRDTLSDNATVTMMGKMQIEALRSEESRVLAKGPDTMREYANYLCAMRKLHEESDEMRHAREEAAH